MDEAINTQKYVVIYPGRFQPFHKGHKEVYDVLVDKFDKDNVFIATSNKVDPPKSPFNFAEKKKIITTMFDDIPVDNVVEVKSPYKPVEILDKFPKSTVAIFVVGNKDAERLKGYGKYFLPLNEKGNLSGYMDHGYYYVAPANKIMYKGSPLSGERIRELFNRYDDKGKAELFERLYGSMNKTIAAMMSKKLVDESEIDTEPSFLLKEAEPIVESEQPSFLITEGGAYGHLDHFHEVKTNTIADLREFIDTVLQGKMEYARLKTDGMNLMFSFINGHLRVARKKTELRDSGKTSMTIPQLSDKFNGRDNVQKAFVSAAKDLQHAIGRLPKEQIDAMFDNGKNWMSVEVLHPAAQNVIPYGVYELRFHGINKYDDKGEIVGEDKEAADKLAKMITDIKQNKQDTYEIKSLEVATFPPLPDFKAQKVYFNKKVDNLKRELGMTEKSTIASAFLRYFESIIKTHAREARYAVPKDVISGLSKRWGLNDKAFSVGDMKSIKNDTFKEWAIDFDKEGAEQAAKDISNKFEYLTLELGARALKNLSSFMVANPQKTVQQLKKGIDDVIRQVQSSKNPELINKMKYELERLSAIGGINAIAPEEGVTFIFKDKFYKLTGTFAPINQLMNLRHRLEIKEPKPDQDIKESVILEGFAENVERDLASYIKDGKKADINPSHIPILSRVVKALDIEPSKSHAEYFGRTQSETSKRWKDGGIKSSPPKTDVIIDNKTVSVKIGKSQLGAPGKDEIEIIFNVVAEKYNGTFKTQMKEYIELMIEEMKEDFFKGKRGMGKKETEVHQEVLNISKKLNRKYEEIMNEPEIKRHFVFEVLTGKEKFKGQSDKAIADWLLTFSKSGENAKLEPLKLSNKDYLNKILEASHIVISHKPRDVEKKGLTIGKTFRSVIRVRAEEMKPDANETFNYFVNEEFNLLNENVLKDIASGIKKVASTILEFLKKIINKVKEAVDKGIEYFMAFMEISPDVINIDTPIDFSAL